MNTRYSCKKNNLALRCMKTTDGLARASYSITRALYSNFDTVCLLIQFNFIELQQSNILIRVAWLFDHPVYHPLYFSVSTFVGSTYPTLILYRNYFGSSNVAMKEVSPCGRHNLHWPLFTVAGRPRRSESDTCWWRGVQRKPHSWNRRQHYARALNPHCISKLHVTETATFVVGTCQNGWHDNTLPANKKPMGKSTIDMFTGTKFMEVCEGF
jgi:hypothetical protein